MTDNIYINNDNRVVLTGLKNESSGNFENSATVTMTLYDSSGNTVSGQSWPASLSYIAASNGNYEGTLDDGLSLTEGADYEVRVTATASGATGEWRKELEASFRYG